MPRRPGCKKGIDALEKLYDQIDGTEGSQTKGRVFGELSGTLPAQGASFLRPPALRSQDLFFPTADLFDDPIQPDEEEYGRFLRGFHQKVEAQSQENEVREPTCPSSRKTMPRSAKEVPVLVSR